MSELFPKYRASWETDQHRELRQHAAAFLAKEATPLPPAEPRPGAVRYGRRR